MKSYLLVNVLLLLSTVACNTHPDKNMDVTAVYSNQRAKFSNVNFGTTLEETLQSWGMTLASGQIAPTRPKLDYEEFILHNDASLTLFNFDLTHKFKHASLFYDKKSKAVFRYEVKIIESDPANEILERFKKKYGKSLFNKENSATSNAVFFDENGNQVKDMAESIYEWYDSRTHILYVLIQQNDAERPVLDVIATYKNLIRPKVEDTPEWP